MLAYDKFARRFPRRLRRFRSGKMISAPVQSIHGRVHNSIEELLKFLAYDKFLDYVLEGLEVGKSSVLHSSLFLEDFVR